jgi:DNA invertase Pin-like site-specific DNA recombinase
MKVGYARVTNTDLNASVQLNALKQAGCKHIFTDKIDGTGKDFPGLETALSYMQEGDTLVVYQLERLGRSLTNLVAIVNQLGARGLEFQSLQESIDTTLTGEGHSVFKIFTILARFEKSIIRERTKAGLSAARARGRKGGRPKGLSETAQRTAMLAEELYLARDLSIREICNELSISKATLYNYLRHRGVKTGAATK